MKGSFPVFLLTPKYISLSIKKKQKKTHFQPIHSASKFKRLQDAYQYHYASSNTYFKTHTKKKCTEDEKSLSQKHNDLTWHCMQDVASALLQDCQKKVLVWITEGTWVMTYCLVNML